ncbi:MAG: S8 family serine peptidase [Chloroflexi bacterium]|nr:S8 family serine peptidase [Chloroflexota bacterium]
MKPFRIGLALSLILSFSLFVAAPAAGQDAQGFAPDRVLVKFKAGTDEATQREVHGRYGGEVVDEIRQLGVKVVRVPAGKVPEKVNAYRSVRAVEFAEPDFVAQAIEVPNDPYFGSQWGMAKIQAPDAWDISRGDGIRIAILDSGVDQNHEDLAGKIVDNRNFTSSRTVDDLYGHGTHVAGIAAAATNNGIGVAGVGYNAVIMNGKVLGDTGSGYYSWIASGITWAADNGAKVINMSLGGSSSSSTLEAAVSYAWNKGVVLAAAAGNDNSVAPLYPAYYANCVAVAATDQSDAKASFSNYDNNWVDVAAPGVAIYSTLPNHKNRMGTTNYGSLNGTSMATPFVAGLAALVWATGYETNGSVRERIESTADQAGTMWSTYSIKRINAYAAVMPAAPGPDSTPPDTTILSGPASVTSSTSANFAWTGSDNVTPVGALVYSYRLDGGDWSAWDPATGTSYTGLSEGTHAFGVKARDEAGNEDSTPASWTWVIDTTPPSISGVGETTTATTATITWTTDEPADSTVNYGLDANYVSSVSNPTLVISHSITLTGLSPATSYHYQASSTDAAGNSASSEDRTFTTAQAATMNVGSVNVILVKQGVNYTGQATVTIVANEQPVQGTAVSGQWSGATADADSGVTDANGRVTLLSDKVLKPAGGTGFTFTVIDVIHPDFVWDGVQKSSSATVP